MKCESYSVRLTLLPCQVKCESVELNRVRLTFDRVAMSLLKSLDSFNVSLKSRNHRKYLNRVEVTFERVRMPLQGDEDS